MAHPHLDLEQVCGQLIVGGFDGEQLPEQMAEELGRGHRGGVISFKKNLTSLEQVVALNRSIIAAAPPELLPFISVDQEGGRVVRLPAPFTWLPPMRRIGAADDAALTRSAAEQVAHELAAVGFNLDFAPVMDVDTNPDNPVIGDRAFGGDPRRVMKHGVAFLRGLQDNKVLACAKHFPGHGDTDRDSHLELPAVARGRERLDRVEIPPFRAASGAGVAAMMTAHVIYHALDAKVPATFSHAICSGLLRDEIGFAGVLFSDDLEMGAIANHHDIEEAAVMAVLAGCDALLVCKDWELQERAHAALVARAQSDAQFEARCRHAADRSLRARATCAPRVERDAAIREAVGGVGAMELLERMAVADAAAEVTEPGD